MKKDIATREDIVLLVNTFYEKLQLNNELDYVFNGVAKLDWDKHLPKMYDFWEAIIFKNPIYSGNPMEVHKQLNEKINLTKSMFENWLSLFNATIDELFEGKNAHEAKTRALSIATMIQMKTIYKNS
mgnify:CR=1 FL=1